MYQKYRPRCCSRPTLAVGAFPLDNGFPLYYFHFITLLLDDPLDCILSRPFLPGVEGPTKFREKNLGKNMYYLAW